MRDGIGRDSSFVRSMPRSANTLNLKWLAYGDPSAPVATVAAFHAPGQIVARVGPGTGGTDAFSRIDPDLARPYTDEVAFGIEKRRNPSTRYTLTGIARRQANLMGVVNTGTSAASYSAIHIDDAGKDHADPADDRTLTVYNRLPASFGQDSYLVTNPGQQAATVFALRLEWEYSDRRLFLLFGATASAALASTLFIRGRLLSHHGNPVNAAHDGRPGRLAPTSSPRTARLVRIFHPCVSGPGSSQPCYSAPASALSSTRSAGFASSG